MRGGLAAVVLALVLAPGARAAKRVTIEAGAFDPPVVVVAPGTEVEWRNADARPHALRGDFSVGEIAPGATGTRRFPRLGRFDYHDRDNRAISATVVVAARGGRRPHYGPPPGGSGGIVEHRWRGTLRMELREQWKYYDGSYRSFEGPCNAEVGTGSRLVTFAATFPAVTYTRSGTVEVLKGESRPYRIPRYRERIDARTSNPSGERFVDCGDGTTDAPPEIEQKCDHDFAGRRVRATLWWSPKSTGGRFLWPHEYLGTPPSGANCGDSFLSPLEPDRLPFDPGAGDALRYDAGRTGPVTPGEARALRNGRAVTITRSLELHFTRDCCMGWHQDDKPGTYVRAGAHFDVFAKLVIRLRPR